MSAPTTTPATTSPEPGTPNRARRPLTRFTRIGLLVVLLLSLTEAVAFGAHYLLVSSRYVTTDNAQVDATAADVVAPADGQLVRWRLSDGDTVRPREVLGRVKTGSGAQVAVRAPGAGRVARTLVADGQWVTAGTRLATAFDPADIHVTARVDETDLGDVRVGAPVRISVDAYPDAVVTGIVTGVQNATAGTQTIFPNPEDDPTNPQPTDQYVPVRIGLLDTGTAEIRPGTNVSVEIRRPAGP